MYYINLKKEYEILSLLYKDLIRIKKEEISVEGEKYFFIIIDKLMPLEKNLCPSEIMKHIESYQKKAFKMENINYSYDITSILEAGFESIEVLYTNELISKLMKSRCNYQLKSLTEEIVSKKKLICHGDLSNNNIMKFNELPLVIDWEDAFIGVESYDFLYWLTFYEQRKYSIQEQMKKNGIELNYGVCLMVLIILIKSQIAFHNRSYVNYELSFENRLSEVLDIL